MAAQPTFFEYRGLHRMIKWLLMIKIQKSGNFFFKGGLTQKTTNQKMVYIEYITVFTCGFESKCSWDIFYRIRMIKWLLMIKIQKSKKKFFFRARPKKRQIRRWHLLNILLFLHADLNRNALQTYFIALERLNDC